jgi:hypothetical protein
MQAACIVIKACAPGPDKALPSPSVPTLSHLVPDAHADACDCNPMACPRCMRTMPTAVVFAACCRGRGKGLRNQDPTGFSLHPKLLPTSALSRSSPQVYLPQYGSYRVDPWNAINTLTSVEGRHMRVMSRFLLSRFAKHTCDGRASTLLAYVFAAPSDSLFRGSSYHTHGPCSRDVLKTPHKHPARRRSLRDTHTLFYAGPRPVSSFLSDRCCLCAPPAQRCSKVADNLHIALIVYKELHSKRQTADSNTVG